MTALNNAPRLGAVALGIVLCTAGAFAQSDALWSGSAQCQLTTQTDTYTHQEVQTWTIPPGTQPTQQGAISVYPATWTVSGTGSTQRPQGSQVLAGQWNSNVPAMNAPIAIFVRASDGRLIIKSFHSGLVAPGGINGVKQFGGSQASIVLAASEWQFPAIEDAGISTNVSGSGTIVIAGTLMPMQVAGASGTANCTWQFTKGGTGTGLPNRTGVPSQMATNGMRSLNPLNSTTSANGNPSTAGSNTAAGTTSLANGNQPKASAPNALAIGSGLPAPTGFVARDMGDGSVQLSWQSVSGAVQYRIDGPGIPSSGLLVPATNPGAKYPVAIAGVGQPASTRAGTRIQKVPLGPGTWQIGSIDTHPLLPPKATATASAVVRYVPPHAGQWLTKNNGAGSPAKAIAHYVSLCPTCAVGMSFSDFLTAMGVSSDALADGNNSADDCLNLGFTPSVCTWTDIHAARYSNATEFGTTRVSRCWEALPGTGGMRTVCYSKSGDHGVTVIVKDLSHAWFLTFAWNNNAGTNLPNTAKEVVNWFGAQSLGVPMQSNYVLTTQVTLDSEGPKSAPHACLSCHGGTFNGGLVSGATLLPLDTGLLRVDDRSDGMAANFAGVNQTVLLHGPSPAVQRYLTGLYGGFPTPASGWGDLDYVPQGWRQQSDFYKAAVRPYCMTCHLATPSNLDFSTYGSFAQNKALINAEVCSGHTMPHAEYPFKQFWTKDTGNLFIPGYLVAALGITSCQ